MTDQTHALPPPKEALPARPVHPLVAVGLGVVAGLLLARLIRR
jgi:hypothetical protein